MHYPILRFSTFILAFIANYLKPRPKFAYFILQAWAVAYLGERWNVLEEVRSTSHQGVRGLAGSRRPSMGMFERVFIGTKFLEPAIH